MCDMSRFTCPVSHIMCHMSCVTCHVSHALCHMSCVTCHVSHGMCNIYFFLQSGGSSQWRVCYQWGLPSLVSELINNFCRTQEGPTYMRLSRFRSCGRAYVRTSVSTLDFSFILHAQFTSDPQYFYRFRSPYIMTIRGADQRGLRPP